MPLVVFTGTCSVLFPQEAARLFAAVDGNGQPQALALLVLDEEGEGMTVTHACTLDNVDAKQRLISELSLKAAKRIKMVISGAKMTKGTLVKLATGLANPKQSAAPKILANANDQIIVYVRSRFVSNILTPG